MDPISSPISNLPAVVQALLLRQGLQPAEVEALLKLVGQELSVLFLGQGAEGAKLELPSGRIVTAQGELPFPEGTQLRVRVEAEAGTLKFQTLEAKPPAVPALLAPLLQGEASSLVAQLQQPAPPVELAPLVQLFRSLGGLLEAPPKPSLPSVEALAKAIAALPEELRQAITLREMEGLSYEEIAETMDCPIGTVRSRIFRAREAIDARLRPLMDSERVRP